MVSWSRSFIVAIKIVIFSIVWAVVGSIITLIGSASVLFAVISNPTAFQGSLSSQALGVIMLTAIIGTIVTALGTIATLVKFTTDEAVKEVSSSYFATGQSPVSTSVPPVQPVGVANVNAPSTPSTETYKICPKCGTPNPPEAKFCKKCGALLP